MRIRRMTACLLSTDDCDEQKDEVGKSFIYSSPQRAVKCLSSSNVRTGIIGTEMSLSIDQFIRN